MWDEEGVGTSDGGVLMLSAGAFLFTALTTGTYKTEATRSHNKATRVWENILLFI